MDILFIFFVLLHILPIDSEIKNSKRFNSRAELAKKLLYVFKVTI